MAIRYLVVRPSGFVPRMSQNKATHITALINRTPNWQQLKFTAADILGITLEQSVLSDYLLQMNPSNLSLQKYRENCRVALERHLDSSPLFKQENLTKEQVHQTTVDSIAGYVFRNQHIGASGLESIMRRFLGGENQFTSVPKNFLYPYLEFQNGKMPEDYSYNPVVLSPVCRVNKESKDTEITFYCRPYTSIDGTDPRLSKGRMSNQAMAYLCAMNHNGRSWKDLIDTIQSLYISEGTEVGTESIAGMLKYYLRLDALPVLISGKEVKRRQLLDALRIIMERDNLVFNKEEGDITELATLFSYLGDNRLKYLEDKDPLVAAKERWDAQPDLAFLDKLAASHGYAMAADDDSASDGGDGSSGDDGGEGEGDQPDSTEDISDGTDGGDGDDNGDDLFGDGDDFADPDEDDSGGESGSGSDSSSTNTSAGDSSSGETADPEDVNPIIEIIEDETFDEYLDRGILEVRIKRMLTNPATSLSNADVEFLKYWYLVWFPCVSVATTREILGKILALPARKISRSTHA